MVMVSRVALADGTKVPALGARSEPDGRFAVGITPSRPDQRSRWLDPLRRSAVTHALLKSLGSALELDNGGDALDLGREYELRVERPPLVWYRAVDTDGKPVAGARTSGHDGGVGEPSGADGLGWAYDHLRPEPFRSLLGAPGRQVVPFSASARSSCCRRATQCACASGRRQAA
jgi:hypothetical protein